MEFKPGYIGLKIRKTSQMAKCVAVLRKYTVKPMSDILKAINTYDYVFLCRYTDDAGIRKIRKCYDELCKFGITTDIYESVKKSL